MNSVRHPRPVRNSTQSNVIVISNGPKGYLSRLIHQAEYIIFLQATE